MLSIQLPTELENQLRDVVQENYHGDLQAAMTAFLKLHQKYGWKEQLQEDVQSIRNEVRRTGGISAKTIDEAVRTYRNQSGKSDA